MSENIEMPRELVEEWARGLTYPIIEALNYGHWGDVADRAQELADVARQLDVVDAEVVEPEEIETTLNAPAATGEEVELVCPVSQAGGECNQAPWRTELVQVGDGPLEPLVSNCEGCGTAGVPAGLKKARPVEEPLPGEPITPEHDEGEEEA